MLLGGALRAPVASWGLLGVGNGEKRLRRFFGGHDPCERRRNMTFPKDTQEAALNGGDRDPREGH
eukprot:8320063-Pyramimonas_sp.AAC.1